MCRRSGPNLASMQPPEGDYPITIAAALSGDCLYGPWPDAVAHPVREDGFEVPLDDHRVVAGFAGVTVPGSSIYVRVSVGVPRCMVLVTPDTDDARCFVRMVWG